MEDAQNHNDGNSVIEIHDPTINAEAIMQQIRENLRVRRAKAEAEGIDLSGWANGIHSKRLGEELYRDIRQVSASASQMGVLLSSAAKPQRRIPLISPLLQHMRRAAHQLVIYYVNQLAAQQNHYNRQIVNVLMRLVLKLEQEPYPDDVQDLQEEVQSLRNEIAHLKSLLEQHQE